MTTHAMTTHTATHGTDQGTPEVRECRECGEAFAPARPHDAFCCAGCLAAYYELDEEAEADLG